MGSFVSIIMFINDYGYKLKRNILGASLREAYQLGAVGISLRHLGRQRSSISNVQNRYYVCQEALDDSTSNR